MLDLLKNISFISEVRISSPNITKELTESFLSLFDCIIYDFQDSWYSRNSEDKSEEIETYIKNNGGSFLVTHDHWDSYPNRGPLHLIGMEYCEWDCLNETSFKESNKAKISYYGHSIFESYYNLSNWRTINIVLSHRTFHRLLNNPENTAKVAMEFEFDRIYEKKYDYLVTNEIGYGRIAYWAAGHNRNISDEEKKLFVNILAWLTKYKK